MKTLVLLALLAATPALAQGPVPEPRILSMSGHGEVRGRPDQARVTAGVTTSAPTAAGALSANTARMQAVFAALEKSGVPEKNIQTANFSVSPQYTNGAGNQAPRLTGYQVNNDISVRLDDVAKLGQALDALVAAGANQMNGIGFSIKDPAPMLEQAREQAVADARARAQTYARAAGVTLGQILSIGENGADQPRPLRMAAPMAFAAKAVPVAAGEESVAADVTITWEIR